MWSRRLDPMFTEAEPTHFSLTTITHQSSPIRLGDHLLPLNIRLIKDSSLERDIVQHFLFAQAVLLSYIICFVMLDVRLSNAISSPTRHICCQVSQSSPVINIPKSKAQCYPKRMLRVCSWQKRIYSTSASAVTRTEMTESKGSVQPKFPIPRTGADGAISPMPVSRPLANPAHYASINLHMKLGPQGFLPTRCRCTLH